MFQRCWAFMLIWTVYMTQFHPHQMVVDASSPENTDPIVIQGPDSSILRNRKDFTGRNISIVGNEFILDGSPLHIVSGSVHYFRLPSEYWRDRLRKLKAAGFNAVATYVEWSFHEPEERQYRFSGDGDVARFVRIAAEEGLLVLLRPGPYICAERDLGGLPYWLLSKYPHIRLRTINKDFVSETGTWMAKLFEHLTPLLYVNGGPIILVQVENEYGSYANDMKYKEQVRDIIKEHVGTNALLYTTDGTSLSMIQGGAVPGAVTTIDFGVGNDLKEVFKPLRRVMPEGPLMNSEFYPGWLTHWGESLQQVSADSVVRSLQDMIENKVNVNMYVFFGGSNFEFSAGANFFLSKYMPDITSYDYDAPLNEAGDPTYKYFAIRKAMEKYNPDLKNITPPTPSPKNAYGKVTVTSLVNLLSSDGRTMLGNAYGDVMGSKLPTFEKLRQRAGLVLYETTLEDDDGILQIQRPRDRVYVYVDGEYQGIISRMQNKYTLSLKSKPNSILSLLVENQGRINYGSHLHDFKGILGEVKFNNRALSGKWNVIGYPLLNVNISGSTSTHSDTRHGPVLYKGQFSLPDDEEPVDTFIDPTGWRKGNIWVNGYNLGRYWPALGPQITLYVPGVWLRKGVNTLQVLELEQPATDHSMTFIDHSILNGSTTISPSIDPNILIFDTQ